MLPPLLTKPLTFGEHFLSHSLSSFLKKEEEEEEEGEVICRYIG